MKKVFGVLLCLMLLFGLVACGNSDGVVLSESESNSGAETGGSDNGGNGEFTNPPAINGSKILLAYFSCTGATEK